MLPRVTDTRLIVLASLAAGVVPVGVVVAVEIAIGPVADSSYFWSPVLGPPLVALAFAARLRLRALWIAVGGFLVELLILAAVVAALSTANWS